MTGNQSIETKKGLAGKSALWYTLAVFFTKGLGFITIPIFTRLMSTGEFGLFNNYAAWQIILISIVGFEGYATVNRARLDYAGKELQEYQFTLLVCSAVASGMLLLLLGLSPSFFEAAIGLDGSYLWIMMLYLMFFPSFSMFQALQRVQYKYKLSAGLTFASSLAATLLAVALVIILPNALMGRIVGQYVPFVVLGFAFFIWYAKTGGRLKISYIKYAVPLCIPLMISVIGSQLLLLGCRIITQHMCGADDVAYLSLATTLTNIVLILTNALSGAWGPYLYDCLEEKAYDNAKSTFGIFLWGTALLSVATSLLAPELVLLLGGDSYSSTVWLVPGFMASCVFSMIAAQYISYETYHKSVILGGSVTLAIGLANLALCALGIALFGFVSVVYANLISTIVLVFVHKIIVRKFQTPDVLLTRGALLPCLLALIAIPVCLGLYGTDSLVIRICLSIALIAFAIACILKNRKDRNQTNEPASKVAQ